jgi:hypothetical protein
MNMIAKQGISRVVVVVVTGDTILGLSTLTAKVIASPSLTCHVSFICHN